MNRKRNPWQIIAVIGSMGMEIILLAVGGAWLGNKLDAAWGTSPFLLLTGVLLGLGLGFISAVYTLKAFMKD
jgi:ATP synthase protein I